MLIAMAGLPGSGKSAVANEVARTLGCTVLSVDPIEGAMWRAGIGRDQPTGLAAYVVAEDLAREQLRLGNDVVVDAVNDVEPARDQWRSLSAEFGQTLVIVEAFCSDEREHQNRLASRRRGIDGFPEPTWESVVARKGGFSDWHDDRVRVDSMRPLGELVDEVLEHLARVRTTTTDGQPTLPLIAEPPNHYLGSDSIIQTDDPGVVALGKELRDRHADDTEFAKASFEWVRDKIAHAYDAQDHRVTLTASEVLAEGVGLCYAKSNLLAAILRSQGIPAGLCYQRLGDPEEGHVLHGLVAVHLDGVWHRQDPRGNKVGIDAQFSLWTEQLAYDIDESNGQRDYPRLYVSTADEVVNALQEASDVLTCQLPADLHAN